MCLCVRVSSQLQSNEEQWEAANHHVNVLQSVSEMVSNFVALVHSGRCRESKREPCSCSQKRKSDDVNGGATNGQTEVKKEGDEDDAEEVNMIEI